MTLAELRSEIFKLKAQDRSRLARAPIEEKFRVLEEMRDFTAGLQGVRAENKARLRAARAGSAAARRLPPSL
jgi:hypothetical protein